MSIKNNINENFDLIYNFSLDNDLNNIEYNSFETNIKFDKFTSLNLLRKMVTGDLNLLKIHLVTILMIKTLFLSTQEETVRLV